MSDPRIRFIVEVITSARNINGNCRHLVRITSTKTGRYLKYEADDPRKYQQLLGEVGVTYEDVYAVAFTLPIREWQRTHMRWLSAKEWVTWGYELLCERVTKLEE